MAVPILEGGQVIAHELLIKTWGRTAGLILICRPEATAVGGEKFVDEEKIILGIETEFEFGIGEDDAGLRRMFSSGFVKGDATIADLAEKIGAQLFLCLGIGHGQIVPGFGLGGGGENRFRKLLGFAQTEGQGPIPGGTLGFIFFPSTAREVTADDALDGEGRGGEAAGETTGVVFWRRDSSGDIESEDVVGSGGRQGFEPEFGNGGEEDAFAGNGVWKDDIVGGDAIGGDQPDFVLPTIDVPDLAGTEEAGGF